MPEKFAKARDVTVHFGVAEEIKHNREGNCIIIAIVFKSSVFKVFSVHTKTQIRRFQILPI